jgi:hypothetical protein
MSVEETVPAVYTCFKQGNFSVIRTGHLFDAVLIDQALQPTLNRDSKTSGGLMGISKNEQARATWFLTIQVCVSTSVANAKRYVWTEGATNTRHSEDR